LGQKAVKGIQDAIEWLLDALILWLKNIAGPISTLNAVLPSATDERHLSEATKVWVASLLLGLVLSFPIFNLFGIKWDNLGFHLSNWLTTIISLVAVAFIVHRTLLALKLRSDFVRTFVMYTTPVVAYTPVINLINLPFTIYLFGVVAALKEQKLPIDVAADTFLQNLVRVGMVLSPFFVFMSLVVSLVGLGCTVVFAEALSQWYGNSRFKTYSAVAVGLTLASVLQIGVIFPMQLLTIYSFLEID
jgi:hypothetical protein